MASPRLLGVLLCYNDGDILADTITSLLETNHHVVAWDHGSTDETAQVLDSFASHLLERTFVPRSVDFYEMYPRMSQHLIANYIGNYDWISWPDQDEILEGPTRAKPYHEYLRDAWESPHNWMEFDNFIYWHTPDDDPAVASPVKRVVRYSLQPRDGGVPRIRAWRASATNMRWFNHNTVPGSKYPVCFRLRHYPMRSAAQMRRRLAVDRTELRRGPINFHYERMQSSPDLTVDASALHVDDGHLELNDIPTVDWRRVYGEPPLMPPIEREAWVLSISRWHTAWMVKGGLEHVIRGGQHPPDALSRLRDWVARLDHQRDEVAVVAIETRSSLSRVISEGAVKGTVHEDDGPLLESTLTQETGLVTNLVLDPASGTLRLRVSNGGSAVRPLIALVPYNGEAATRVRFVDAPEVSFDNIGAGRYVVAVEPVVRAES